MPRVGRIPDVEALAVNALAADVELDALIAGRISTELPSSFPDGPRIRLTRAGGNPVDEDTERLDRPVVQIEAFGDDQGAAFDTVSEAMRALLELAGGTFPEGVVTKVVRLSGPVWSPDPETSTPRYLLSAALYVHTAG